MVRIITKRKTNRNKYKSEKEKSSWWFIIIVFSPNNIKLKL